MLILKQATTIFTIFTLLLILILAISGCRTTPTEAELPLEATMAMRTIVAPTTTSTPSANNLPTTMPTPAISATARATAAAVTATTPTPFFTGTVEDCGQILPILSAYDGPITKSISPDAEALAYLQTIMPAEAAPALDHILAAPGTVGLAVYQVGNETNGAFLNADVPMPLASVVKVIDLVAYAEAIAAEELDPLATVALDDLAAYYLPSTDLRAHPNALADLEEKERVFGQPPTILLDEVPGMMIEYSSNAATDYLHMLLGQRRIEETAVALNLSSQTAPCPFVGQFLAMANHLRTANNDYAAVQEYITEPARYGRDVMQFTAAFSSDSEFRQAAIDFRQRTRRPTGPTQRFFSDNLNAQGSASDYASLMARIAQNGLSNGDSSFITRRYLEWPMRFPDNQVLFSNLGYKGGSLPGILTTVYYAYPRGTTTPVVIALFFRDLESSHYRQWRSNQAHDEFARWLLADPEAIPALRAALKLP